MKLHLWRSHALLVLIVLSIMTLGQKFGHRDGLVISTVFALSIIGLFFWHGDWRLLPSHKLRELVGQDPWQIRITLKTLSDRARLPLPRVFIIPSDAPQALAVGRSPSHAKIFLTSGLVEQFSSEELEATLAYTLMCIKSRATLAFSIASALADILLTAAAWLDWTFAWMFGTNRSHRGRQFKPFTWATLPFACAIVRLAVGRAPYWRADQAAAQLLGDGKMLAQILWKLQSYALTRPFPASPAASHFFIVNPLTMNGIGRYFHAQPEVQGRIKNLIGNYPI